MGGAQRRITPIREDKLQAQPLEVLEHQRSGSAGAWVTLDPQAGRPEVQRVVVGHAKLDAVDHSGAGPPAGRPVEVEPREDRPGRADLVAEVQVVRVRLIEVDRLLDQPETENIGVELDVRQSVTGDHRDVVQPVKTQAVRSLVPVGVGGHSGFAVGARAVEDDLVV